MLFLKLISASVKMFNSLVIDTKVGYASSGINGITKLTRRHNSSHQISETEAKQQLCHSYSVIVDGIISHHGFSDMPFDEKLKLKEMLNYNLSPTRYMKVPYSILQVHDHLNANDQLPMDKRESVYIMALCCHMIHTAYEVLDDIVDNDSIRHNKPSWHTTKDGNSLNALNDGVLLSGLAVFLLKRFFSHHKNYQQMVELFNLQHVYTMLGQRMDCTNRCPIEQMNMHRWVTLAKYKTAYHQSIIQFKSTLLLTDTYEDDKFQLLEPILMDAGILLQMWNDFLDAFPQNSIQFHGKPPSDIQEGKCTWVLAKALELCNAEQICVLKENYGKKENSSVDKVQHVFEDLALKELGEKFRNEFYQNIQLRIAELSNDYPKLALESGLNSILS